MGRAANSFVFALLIASARASACPSPVFEHLAVEVYAGVNDCDRGTIQADADAAGLPINRDHCTISLEFNCAVGVVPSGWLYSYGSQSGNDLNGLLIMSNGVKHDWWNGGLASDATGNLCDGEWHAVQAHFDGATRSTVLDGLGIEHDDTARCMALHTTAAHVLGRPVALRVRPWASRGSTVRTPVAFSMNAPCRCSLVS